MENLTQNQQLVNNVSVSDDEQELNYWSKEFGIAKEELIAVVKRGGTFAAAVEAYVMKLKVVI